MPDHVTLPGDAVPGRQVVELIHVTVPVESMVTEAPASSDRVSAGGVSAGDVEAAADTKMFEKSIPSRDTNSDRDITFPSSEAPRHLALLKSRYPAWTSVFVWLIATHKKRRRKQSTSLRRYEPLVLWYSLSFFA